MLSGWRIGSARHAKTLFSGAGARRYGGRWNSPGRPLVYLSEHQSLAALEIFIHTQPLSPRNPYVVIAAEWDEALTERLSERALPADWRTSPPGAEAAALGDRWVKEARSAVMAVPSAIIPTETNYLLNPAHPDFRRIRIYKPTPFVFDPRLLQR